MELVSHGEGSLRVAFEGRDVTFGRPIHGVWTHDGRLLVLLDEGGERVLEIYDATTIDLEHRIEAPEGWSFYILIPWRDQAAIVATSEAPIHHRHDFHWLIDVDAGTIEQHVPFV